MGERVAWKPLKYHTKKCAAIIDDEGKRCARRAQWVGPVFLDASTPDPDVDQVMVELCGLHAAARPVDQG